MTPALADRARALGALVLADPAKHLTLSTAITLTRLWQVGDAARVAWRGARPTG